MRRRGLRRRKRPVERRNDRNALGDTGNGRYRNRVRARAVATADFAKCATAGITRYVGSVSRRNGLNDGSRSIRRRRQPVVRHAHRARDELEQERHEADEPQPAVSAQTSQDGRCGAVHATMIDDPRSVRQFHFPDMRRSDATDFKRTRALRDVSSRQTFTGEPEVLFHVAYRASAEFSVHIAPLLCQYTQ